MAELAVIALCLAPAPVVLSVLTWSVVRSNARPGARPSDWLGMRTAATKASPEAWVRGHCAALPASRTTMRIGLVSVGAVLALVLASLVAPHVAVLALGTSVAAVLVVTGGCVHACVVADRAARG